MKQIELAGVVGKWEVEGVNENGEHLVDGFHHFQTDKTTTHNCCVVHLVGVNGLDNLIHIWNITQ